MKSKSTNFLANQQILTTIGVAITVIVAVIAVTVALYQQGRGPLAPTAPVSQPSASSFISETCSLSFNVASDSDVTCDKKAYQDEFDNTPGFYHLRTPITTIKAGENIVWSVDTTNNGDQPITISLTDILNNQYIEFLDSDCGADAFNPDTLTLTCPPAATSPNQTVTRNFRVRVKPDTPIGQEILNTATARHDDNNTQSCTASVIVVSQTEEKLCNEICETDKECADGLICYDTGNDYRCRLPSNPVSSICQPVGVTPTATATPPVNATATPVSTCPQYILPQTKTWTDGETDIITLVSGGPITYEIFGQIVTDGYREYFRRTGTLQNGQSITVTYPPMNEWGPAGEYGVREIHVTLHTNGECGYFGHGWDRFFHANITGSPQPSNTPTGTPGTGGQPTPTATRTPSPTVTVSGQPTPTMTLVPTATVTPGGPSLTPTNTPSPTLTPTPAPGCNDSCTTNADCSNSDHFCYDIGNGNYQCRLASNPNSTTCSPIVPTNTPVSQTISQPGLPSAGSESNTTLILVTAGIVVLILGALGLLLLL